MSATSYKDLEKALKKAMDKALVKAGKDTKKLVQDKVDSDVYKKYSPKEYERTGDLRDSVTDFPLEKKGDKSSVTVKHDTDMMSYNPGKFQHASPYWSPWNYTKYVPQTVNDGLSGGLFGNGAWRAPRPYFDNAVKDLEKGKFREFMEDGLKQQGLKIK